MHQALIMAKKTFEINEIINLNESDFDKEMFKNNPHKNSTIFFLGFLYLK